MAYFNCFYGVKKSEIDVSIPIMTSDNTPSGECVGDSFQNNRPFYHAFDGDDSTRWISQTPRGNACWIGYEFPYPVKITRAEWEHLGDSYITSNTYKYQAYDGNDWVDISELKTSTALKNTDVISNNESYTKYRLYINTQLGSAGNAGQIISLQFYGRAYV